jgi:DNA-binding NtrC family response regulator
VGDSAIESTCKACHTGARLGQMTAQWQCRACEKQQAPADKCIRCGSRPLRTLAEVEREAIMRALEHFQDINLAAEFLGCCRKTIYNKIKPKLKGASL